MSAMLYDIEGCACAIYLGESARNEWILTNLLSGLAPSPHAIYGFASFSITASCRSTTSVPIVAFKHSPTPADSLSRSLLLTTSFRFPADKVTQEQVPRGVRRLGLLLGFLRQPQLTYKHTTDRGALPWHPPIPSPKPFSRRRFTSYSKPQFSSSDIALIEPMK